MNQGRDDQASPDVMAKIHLYAGGRGHRPIQPGVFGCPLRFGSEAFDCRLYLQSRTDPLRAGDTAIVPIRFLFREHVIAYLKVGERFTLWDLGEFAEGEVLEVLG